MRIRTTSFKLIEKQISYQFGSHNFSMIITEDIRVPFREDQISKKWLVIGDFKIRPESLWAGSDSCETCVADSFADASAPMEVEKSRIINVNIVINSEVRISKVVNRLEQGKVDGDGNLKSNVRDGCRVPRTMWKEKSVIATGEDKEEGINSITKSQDVSLGLHSGLILKLGDGTHTLNCPEAGL